MSEQASGSSDYKTLPRVLGRVRGAHPGPKMVVMTGIHGNEPAGAAAGDRVLKGLQECLSELSGEFVVLRGNRPALMRRDRFIVKDFNRTWTPERVTALREADSDADLDSEDREMVALLETLDEELLPCGGNAYFLDLHTTSAEGVPFALFGDTLRNRAFAERLPLPIILGLEEQLDGTLLEYVNRLGFVTLGCEGGQHDRPESVDHIEALLWCALRSASMLSRSVDISEFFHRLRRVAENVPSIIEVRYRHAIRDGDGFRMTPGFTNFNSVTVGQSLAHDKQGEIRARWGGWLLMPLYQGKGNDGFFLASEVHPLWLRVSAVLRRLHLAGALQLLPGVTRHPDRDDSLVVNTRIARWFPLEIFHLFGFRKLRWQGPVLVVSRRPFDLKPPTSRRS